MKFEIINFASDNFTLIASPEGKDMTNLCEYKQLMSSNPDIVISMLGGKDSFYHKNFTPEAFVTKYSKFIDELKSMPSKPEVMLISPIYNLASILQQNQPFMFNPLYGKNLSPGDLKLGKWEHSQTDTQSLLTQVALKNFVKFDDLIDSEKIVKEEASGTMVDVIHPNDKGYGILAQEIYNRFALSPTLNKRIRSVYEQGIDLKGWQKFNAQEIKERDDGTKLAAKSQTKKGSLLQQSLSKLTIDLSQKCHDQSYVQAKEALLPGHKFKFQMFTPKEGNEIRIAVVGDSAAQGCCGTTHKEVLAQAMSKRLTDQSDGSQQGLQGWPYLLHSLLENNNNTIDYTIMNYAVQDATIIPGANYHSFKEDCRYEQLQKSMPHYVFMAFGSVDSHLKNYTENQFIESYVNLIKETQMLPTKPMVFLMSPVATCQQPIQLKDDSEKLSELVTNSSECSKEQNRDMQETIFKIADQTFIPRSHVVNAWSMLRDPKRASVAIAQDGVHPNLKGMGEIAQEFFMKMSLSPEYMERQKKILSGQDADYSKVLNTLQQKSELLGQQQS